MRERKVECNFEIKKGHFHWYVARPENHTEFKLVRPPIWSLSVWSIHLSWISGQDIARWTNRLSLHFPNFKLHLTRQRTHETRRKMPRESNMDGGAARRIMSNAYGNEGSVSAGSFAARAQSAAQRNMNAGTVPDWSATRSSGYSKGSGGEIRGRK